MSKERFKDALWCTPQQVLVGGQGGIGSWLTLFLSRIGYELIIYDDDSFEEHNMSGQFITNEYIGIKKVTAVSKLVHSFGASNKIHSFDERININTPSALFVMGGFDNMTARKHQFDAWFEHNKNEQNEDAILIDGRLSMEQFQIFCVTPKTTKEYREKYLFNDDEVEETVCSLKQTSHTAAMIAGFMTGFLTNHITNMIEQNKARTVPFKTEYFLPLNMFSNVS